MGNEVDVVYVPVGEDPVELRIPADEDGSTHRPLQDLVDGNIELVRLFDGIDVYVNDCGLWEQPANRAVFATRDLDLPIGELISMFDGRSIVEEGDLFSVLFGPIVAVGYDPETGRSRSLTAGEAERVSRYFTDASPAHSGQLAVAAIRMGAGPDMVRGMVEEALEDMGRKAAGMRRRGR